MVSGKYEAAKALISWWRKYRREFPWRNARTPYEILIAEILLHRTKADQVVPVYNRFLSSFPSVKHLASATPEDVLDIIRPLGLAWRAPLLVRMACRIMETSGGTILDDRSWLLSLPGISDYTASAVLCFAFEKRASLLDTNTIRILGRMENMTVNDNSRRNKKFHQAYLSLMCNSSPRDFGYAMIDLGALVCAPRNPRCDDCPINFACSYCRNKKLL